MFGYTDRIRGDRGPGDHKGTPLPWTNGPGEPIQVYAMGPGDRGPGPGDHKGSPLPWTNGPGEPIQVYAMACLFRFMFIPFQALRISGGLVWGERAGGVAVAGMGAGY